MPPPASPSRAEIDALIAKLNQRAFDQVIARGEKLCRAYPRYATTLNILGAAYAAVGRTDDAIATYGRALAISPGAAIILNNLGNAWRDKRDWDKAIAAYRSAIAAKPDLASAFNNLGSALKERGDREAAVAAYRQAVKLQPGYAEAYVNLGTVWREEKKFDLALQAFERALALRPDMAIGHYNLATVFHDQNALDKALHHYRTALAIQPDFPQALAQKIHVQGHICDWSDQKMLEQELAGLGIDGEAIPPFTMLASEDDPARLRRRAEGWSRKIAHIGRQALAPMPMAPGGRLKIGYFSADFHDHATMRLLIGFFEQHDPAGFELHIFSYGATKQGALRDRLIRRADGFHDVHGMGDAAVVELARRTGLHIAVDLKGYTRDSRAELFAHGLAPVQIAYMGFPGTSGSPFIDYVIADRRIIPAEERSHYSESVTFLPDSYWVNDDRLPLSDRRFSREELGLPERGFVFASFNNSYKITPREFDIWMRLLTRVEGSVLWLLRANPWAETHLRREAQARGVDPERLVFADPMANAEHLVRQAHADLFLDSFNCNAHTTATDALWVGLPVLTRAGRQFAARVGLSLLYALDMPELVTWSDAEYEERALALASDPTLLAAVKAKVERHRSTTPLFDTALSVRHFEAAYRALYQRHVEGLSPTDIEIAP